MNDVSGEREETSESKGQRFLELRNNGVQEMGLRTWEIEEQKALICSKIIPYRMEKHERQRKLDGPVEYRRRKILERKLEIFIDSRVSYKMQMKLIYLNYSLDIRTII